MNCEICGKPIEGRPIRTKIDGSVLEVCKECSKFGRTLLLRENLFLETKRAILKDLKQTSRMFKEDAEKNLWMS